MSASNLATYRTGHGGDLYYDQVTLLTQLQLMPAPVAAR